MRKINLRRFLREVKDRHTLQRAHPFCFVLGAGASKQSGIPTGGELVDRWLGVLHSDGNDPKAELAKWAATEDLDIKDFDHFRRAEFYGKIYAKRFAGANDTGYADMQAQLSGKEPSFGYSILAYILANTQHKVVITTNFDNLVADALYLYSNTAPIQCVHESLAPFISTQLDRPLVVKIHRDLLLNPRSAEDEIEKLHTDWNIPLTRLLSHFTPIFIGYGGNDGSLMGFLEKLPAGVPDRLYWCTRGQDAPNDRVEKLLNKRNGTLVSIQGFDEIMLALKEALEIPDLLPDLEDRHRKRVERYQKQFSELNKAVLTASKAVDATPDQKVLGQAASAAVKQLEKEDTPDSWILRAQAETDKDKAEALYQQALKKHPGNGDIMCAFGEFLADERQRIDNAEDLIRGAYEADRNNPDRLRDYGTFLWYSRGNGSGAEPLLREAVKHCMVTLGPEHPSTLASRNNLANALYTQGKYSEAEAEHRTVLKLRRRVLGEDHQATLSSWNNLAVAMDDQGKYPEAEAEHRTRIIIEKRVLGEDHPDVLRSRINLGWCLNNQGKYDGAAIEHHALQEILARALGPEHLHALINRSYLACAMNGQGKHADAAAEHEAVQTIFVRVLGPENLHTLMNRSYFACALNNQGKHVEAEEQHREVLAIQERVLGAEHPDTLRSLYNLALCLRDQKKLLDALVFVERAKKGRMKVLGPDHPDFKKTKAAHHDMQEKFKAMTAVKRKKSIRK